MMRGKTKTVPFKQQPVFSLCTDNKSLKLNFPNATFQNKANTASHGVNAEKMNSQNKTKAQQPKRFQNHLEWYFLPLAVFFVCLLLVCLFFLW